jgi:hypothetical protein
MESWIKAKTTIDAAHQLSRGGVQREDARYNSETRLQQPSDPPPFHTQQQTPQQYGQSASYYHAHPSSPFQNTMAQAPHQGSSPALQAYTWAPPQSGYGQHQDQVMGHDAYSPAPNYGHDHSQGFYQTPQNQPRTIGMPDGCMNPQASCDAWSTTSTYNGAATPHEYDSSPPPLLYNNPPNPLPCSYTLHRSATEYGQCYDPAPSLGPRSHTLPGRAWEEEVDHECHHDRSV